MKIFPSRYLILAVLILAGLPFSVAHAQEQPKQAPAPKQPKEQPEHPEKAESKQDDAAPEKDTAPKDDTAPKKDAKDNDQGTEKDKAESKEPHQAAPQSHDGSSSQKDSGNDSEKEAEQKPDKDSKEDSKGKPKQEPKEAPQKESGQEPKEDSKEGSKKPSLREIVQQKSRDRTERFSKRAKKFTALFQPIAASAADSTVRIMSGDKQLALGAIIDSDGFILNKASELQGEISVAFPDGVRLPAKVFGIHPESDLALLKVDRNKLTGIQWSQNGPPTVGQWLITPTGKPGGLDVGVVGVNQRKIPPSSPFIGIMMSDMEDAPGVRIMSVVAKSPADDAGLLVGDIITQIDDVATDNIAGLRKTLGQYDANDRITLEVTRAGKKRKIKLTLAERDKVSPANDRSNQQNSMGSKLSRRRKDFPNAFQHDSMLTSKSCGGPVVDLSGKVVGINIARAGRVSSLSLPNATVLPIIERLKTGKWSPDIVNKERIASIDAELKELAAALKELPGKKDALSTKYQIEKAKRDELERILKEVENRLKVIDLKTKGLKSELDSVTRDLRNNAKTKKRLETDRKQLVTGVR